MKSSRQRKGIEEQRGKEEEWIVGGGGQFRRIPINYCYFFPEENHKFELQVQLSELLTYKLILFIY